MYSFILLSKSRIRQCIDDEELKASSTRLLQEMFLTRILPCVSMPDIWLWGDIFQMSRTQEASLLSFLIGTVFITFIVIFLLRSYMIVIKVPSLCFRWFLSTTKLNIISYASHHFFLVICSRTLSEFVTIMIIFFFLGWGEGETTFISDITWVWYAQKMRSKFNVFGNLCQQIIFN